MKHLAIVPDTRLHNGGAERLAQALCHYRSFWDRYKTKEEQTFISEEITLKRRDTTFTITTNQEEMVERSVVANYPNVSIEEAHDPFEDFSPCYTSIMNFKHHYFLSLSLDKRVNWLTQLLETTAILKENEKVIVQILCVPLHFDWWLDVDEGYRSFKEGHIPRMVRLNKKELKKAALNTLASTVIGLHSTVVELIGIEPEKYDIHARERNGILKNGEVSEATKQKGKGYGYNVQISIAIECETDRSSLLAQLVHTAFRALDGDNVLEPTVKSLKWFEYMKQRKVHIMTKNWMNANEVARLYVLPTRYLQETFHIRNVKQQHTTAPVNVLKEGILIGHFTERGEKHKVYMPTANWDELCLPTCILGGMGSGKTSTFGANRTIEAVKNGFGSIFIDPAKKEVTAEVMKELKPEQYEIINISQLKPSFDWVECKYAPNARGLLADAVLSFFEDSLEDAAQTERYLRSFVIAMRTHSMKEIFEIMENVEYREVCISEMRDGIHKSTLQQYHQLSDAMRARIVQPIYTRMDMLMGDTFLGECFENGKSIDMVEVMSQKKAFVFDISKSDGLTARQINAIGNLLMTKINIAMQMRSEENQFPFFITVDEPHQFSKSSRLWESMAVESRKWRVAFNWLFHYWEQIPKGARLAIKNAGPHYHLYRTSKETFKEFLEELKPFTLDECLSLPIRQSFTILRVGGETTPAFVVEMLPPPTRR